MAKRYIIEHLKLMQEWDWEKNNFANIFPDQLTQGSHKKAHWLCTKGHSWDAEIKSRVSGNGCRYCAGQAVTPERSLAVVFPNIAKEWDYERNYPLTPKDVSHGSSAKNFFWICPICNQSYPKNISNRTAPSKKDLESKKCPVCLGRHIISGFNSLKAKYPEIVAKEWDYEKNTCDPDTLAPHNNKPKVWWKCSNNHSYEASINNKTSNNGGDCPYCSHQKLSNETSLTFCNPELANEWCKHKNRLSPDQVFANSNQYAWWKCERGHIWKAKINNRSNGRGCPECSKWRQTSFPEQVVYHYVMLLFPDAINSYKHNKLEVDVFIPSLRIGIEYDGEFYHQSEKRLKNDLRKNSLLHNDGIQLIRIRENNCPEMQDDNCIIYKYKFSSNYKKLEIVLKQLLDFICSKANIQNNINIDIKEIKNEILKVLSKVPLGDDLASRNIPLSKEWDYTNNYPLTPLMFLPNSSKKVHWTCVNCGYNWEAQIGSRNSGSGCSRCAKKHHYTTEEWIERAMEVHGDRYDYSKVNYIKSKDKVTIICSIHGEFPQPPSEHLSGKGCKWCAGQGGFHELNTLAYAYPDLAKEWDYQHEDNKGLTPNDVLITDNTNEYWWKCNNGKPHSYHAKISFRIKRKSGCAVCHGKQVAHDTSIEFIRPDLVSEWHKSNLVKLSEVSLGSEEIIVWKCSIPEHQPYKMTVYNRVKAKFGCSECSGNIKTDLTYRKELQCKFPYIELLSEYEQSSIKVSCKCSICDYKWQPFPFNVLRGKGCPKCKGIKL